MSVPFVPYQPGTISVTNGSTAVVGSGTTFTLQYQAYDWIIIGGVPYLIQSITDDTHLVLMWAFAGTTAAGLAYIWVPMPDLTRSMSAALAVKAAAANGVLAALATAGSAADKIAYYTGAGAAALTSLTSWARSLLGASSAVAGYDLIRSRATTAVVAAATLDLTTTNGDLVPVTGNTGISTIKLGDGAERTLVFTGTPLITVSSTLKLNNGGSNYQVVAGDQIRVRGDASLGTNGVRGVIHHAAGSVPLDGSIAMTGNLASNGGSLALNAPAGNDAHVILRRAAAGSIAGILSYTGSNPRWSLLPGTGTAESGGNAGSDFALYAYGDDGSYVGNALSITRKDIHANFGGTLSEAGQRVYSPNNQPFVPTSSALPPSWSGPMLNNSGSTIGDGATVAGSSLKALAVGGAAQSGTWTNITGVGVASSSQGLFVRIA